jgi:hypothetical protein
LGNKLAKLRKLEITKKIGNVLAYPAVMVLRMNIHSYSNSLKVAALAVALTYGVGARAATIPATVTFTPGVGQGSFQEVSFRDRPEADMLRRAYQILATGDHDYKGHRAKAMQEVEEAGRMLDMDLHGDLKDHKPQFLSDDKMREAKGLLEHVLDASEVKGQERISKHVRGALDEIHIALDVR